MAEYEPVVDRQRIHDDWGRVRTDFHGLVAHATTPDLARRTDGTAWTNRQMLWHMAFGLIIVRRLLPLVRFFDRVPDSLSRGFAAGLDSARRPFHLINYAGGMLGGQLFSGRRLTRLCDHTLDSLHSRLDAETDESLTRSMHFPVGWDPFFGEVMALADVYRYGIEHYDFHRAQLTVDQPRATGFEVRE